MITSHFIQGVVIDTSDPQQMGRVKVWCPAIDGDEDEYIRDNIPWASYVSPFAGQAYDYPAGQAGMSTPGPVSYGFWAVPKVGATVIIGFLYGDRNQRFYMGAFFPEHGNRSLPAGRNGPNGPTSDTEDLIQPANASLQTQFQGNLQAPEAQTRGAYERQVAQPLTEKNGAEGYQQDVKAAGFDPQTYCLVTPGRHALIMQDNPTNGRIRIKTAEGHQVILDDANERIYVSTAKGATWIELDQDGRVHVYAGDSVSITSGGDFNLSAAGNVNIQAGGNLNLLAGGYGRLSACSDISLSSDGASNFTSGGGMNLNAGGTLLQTAPTIHLNGPDAAKAPCATAPTTVPQHEPWERAASKVGRGKNWKA